MAAAVRCCVACHLVSCVVLWRVGLPPNPACGSRRGRVTLLAVVTHSLGRYNKLPSASPFVVLLWALFGVSLCICYHQDLLLSSQTL